MKKIVFILSLCFVGPASAAPLKKKVRSTVVPVVVAPTPTPPAVEPMASSTVVAAPNELLIHEKRSFGLMSIGWDVRMERDQEQGTAIRQSPSFSVGYGYKHWLALGEYSQFRDNLGGNDTLSVSRIAETLMLWGQWHTDEEWQFRPFFAAGFGAYRESADSRLYDETRTDHGRWRDIYGASFGFRWASFSPIWLSMEGRVLFSRELDPSPMLGGLVRLGFVLE